MILLTYQNILIAPEALRDGGEIVPKNSLRFFGALQIFEDVKLAIILPRFILIYVNMSNIDPRIVAVPMYSMLGYEIRIFSRGPTALGSVERIHDTGLRKGRHSTKASTIEDEENQRTRECRPYENPWEFAFLTYVAPPSPRKGIRI